MVDESHLSDNDRALLAEAVRRVSAGSRPGPADGMAIRMAVMAEIRRGRRDLFGLIKAGRLAT